MSQTPPPRLQVETSMHGFRCVLPRRTLGGNSSWILLFVPAWWAVGLSVLFALDQLRTGFGAPIGDEILVVVGGVALLGWGIGWPLFDHWWAARRPIPLVVEPTGLTVDGEEHLFSELTEVVLSGTGLLLSGPDGRYQSIGRLTDAEHAWLEQALADATEGRLQGGQAMPAEARQLSRTAYEQASRED